MLGSKCELKRAVDVDVTFYIIQSKTTFLHLKNKFFFFFFFFSSFSQLIPHADKGILCAVVFSIPDIDSFHSIYNLWDLCHCLQRWPIFMRQLFTVFWCNVILSTFVRYPVLCLVWFDGISTIVGYLMLNPVHWYILDMICKQKSTK